MTEGGNFGGLITPILVRLFDMQPPFAHDTNHQRRPAYPNHTLMDHLVHGIHLVAILMRKKEVVKFMVEMMKVLFRKHQ